MRMIAMVDCNNFYASCERLFNPKYVGWPVIVLSNNDGCVIARSQEAKDLGVKMGAPYFMILELIKEHKIAVFSSNYRLYADMSARVMNNLARFTPDVEVYSIDECFLQFDFHESVSLQELALKIRSQVTRNTGIPISVGIASSKTLAKIANKIAKKDPLGVMVLDSDDKITEKLASFPIEDVWGIGRAGYNKYSAQGLKYAGEIRDQPLDWIQKTFTIQGVRMWHELYGRAVIPFGYFPERKKGICSSRSFGKLTDDILQIKEATVSYTTRVAEKLRADKSCCSLLNIRLITNKFRSDLKQYYPSISVPLAQPMNNTPDLVKIATKAVDTVYRPGYMFLKVEVIATGLIPESEVQLNLFNNWCGKKKDKVSDVMDVLNSHYGKGTIRMAGESYVKKWSMRREHLSPNYTTNWNDIIKV
nr:Y-family DNA polymerase [uncultured Pedobacter sp.]